MSPLDILFQRADTAWAAGSLGCQVNLGTFYSDGIGVKTNRAKGMHWYKRAFRKGYSAAAHNIGIVYRVEGDLSKALAWFERAISLGDIDANLDVAKIYLKRGENKKAIRHLKQVLRAKSYSEVMADSREEAQRVLKGVGASSAMNRTYFHLDMDAFFVSVEELFDPSLKGKPVVVGGRPNERGVVSAASYAARKFGVHSAMPLRTAHKLCPQAIFVEGHRERYREYSGRVFEVLKQFTPTVEMASIDEAYLDLTGTQRLHGPPLAAAHKLHAAVHRATNLNCSIGVAASRMVAKVASDQAKPNGVLWIMPGQEASFLAPLDVRKIPGVGKVTERNLHACGIRKVGDLAALDPSFLKSRFGEWGVALAGKSRGEDAGGWFDQEIGEGGPKSISHEHTFSVDTGDAATLDAMLVRLAEMVARRLRDHRLFMRTIQIKLRYSDFSTFTRSRTLDRATQIDADAAAAARELFHTAWNGKPIRLLGVYAQSLDASEGQASLLEEDKTQAWRKTLEAVDKMRDKYGDEIVSLASGMKAAFRARVHENPENLPGKEPRKMGTPRAKEDISRPNS